MVVDFSFGHPGRLVPHVEVGHAKYDQLLNHCAFLRHELEEWEIQTLNQGIVIDFEREEQRQICACDGDGCVFGVRRNDGHVPSMEMGCERVVGSRSVVSYDGHELERFRVSLLWRVD